MLTNGYEALPIFRSATALAVMVDRVVRSFPRFHKYQLGVRLRDSATNVVLLTGRAYRRGRDRAETLGELCDTIEELKLLVNLGKEVKAFASFNQYAQAMEQVVNVARQAEGWRKASQRPSRSGLRP